MTGICWFDGQMRVDEINDTPRTDAFLENALSAIHETETIEDFTRQLERDLAAERERADRNQEDAERYRWLRDTDTAVVAWIEEDGPRWSIEGRDGHKITRDKLDAAIDAARGK